MAWMSKSSWDWCHVCGSRSNTCVQVVYPYNAEHAAHNDYNCDWGFRICSKCAELIADVGNGKRQGTVRTQKYNHEPAGS